MIAIVRLEFIAQVVRTGRNGVATGIAGVLREMDNTEEKRRCKRIRGILASFGAALNLGRRPEVNGRAVVEGHAVALWRESFLHRVGHGCVSARPDGLHLG